MKVPICNRALSAAFTTRLLALVALVCVPSWSEAAVVAGAVPAGVAHPSTADTAHAAEPMTELDAWHAAKLMGMGINIGNTLDNTSQWEVGWGNPRITKEYIGSLAALGFKTVRLPVAWDTYAREGRIQPDKLARVGEIIDWITAAGSTPATRHVFLTRTRPSARKRNVN
jgi:aryl-phospho-beta-D-glucosidase BglC (GH1 family)